MRDNHQAAEKPDPIECFRNWLVHEHKEPVINERWLRFTVGALAIMLPLLLVIIGYFHYGIVNWPLDSISDYYHTKVGYIFSGTLAAVAFFLFAYRGYDGWDILASKVAGLCAIGIIIFPTSVRLPLDNYTTYLTFPGPSIISDFHFTFATIFFIVLILFAAVLFPLSYRKYEWQQMTLRMRIRLCVYRICSGVMLLSIIIIAIYKLEFFGVQVAWKECDIVFWGEATALWAFGVSWLTKSHHFWPDEEMEHFSMIAPD